MTEYRPGQSAAAVHSAIKAAVRAMENAKQNAVLWFGEILERKLYLELGYSSINQYAQHELGFSTSRTGDFLNICRRLKDLPQVEAKLKTGELGYTQAREVVKVADENNQEEWLKFAQENSRRQLEREVKRAKQEAADQAVGQPSLLPLPAQQPTAAAPVRVSLEMSPTQFGRYEALWQAVRKQGAAPADKVEALLEALACYVAESSPRGDAEVGLSGNNINANTTQAPPYQIHIHQCPDCAKATVQTSKGELELSPAELAQAQCDCRTSEPGQRNTSAIAPAVRREVLARDRHRCQRPGCGHTRFLEVHHIVSRAAGGGNEAENLVTLCSACHTLHHEKKLEWRDDVTRTAKTGRDPGGRQPKGSGRSSY